MKQLANISVLYVTLYGEIYTKYNEFFQALSPRADVGMTTFRTKKRSLRENSVHPAISVSNVKLAGDVDPAAVVAAFKVESYYKTFFFSKIETIHNLVNFRLIIIVL